MNTLSPAGFFDVPRRAGEDAERTQDYVQGKVGHLHSLRILLQRNIPHRTICGSRRRKGRCRQIRSHSRGNVSMTHR